MNKQFAWLTAILILAVAFTGPGVRSQAQPVPILLVVNSAATNQYGPYLAEILRAEGINTFTVAQLSTVTATSLADTKLVVLAETALSDAQAITFSNFVAGGGRLVAMRPDARLSSTLGITSLGTSTTAGYIRIDNAGVTGAGFTNTTLPFQGTADNYAIGSGASALATTYSGQSTPTTFPAIVLSGRTATWAYDLARSVAYTRQGNPANAGVDRDGLPPLRTNDVFYNALDKDRVNIPHADVQMRLLARVIRDLLADATPLPTLWYFPGGAKTMLIVTADSHANPQQWFDDEISAFNARGIKASVYINGGASPSVASVNTWRSQGHEVGMHPTGNQVGKTLDQAFTDNQSYFSANGYGTPSSTTRNHQLEWLGWVDAAKVAANHGIAMDTSFYTWGPEVTYPDGHEAHGYINGSGQLMRFVDQTGAMVPVWQLVTSLIDEQLIVNSTVYSELMTGAEALAVSQQLIDASQAGDYAAILTQFHVDYYGWDDVQTWANGTMDYANSLGIPNRTAEGFLRYTTDRASTGITGLSWQAGPRQLTFTVAVPSGGAAQTLTVPASHEGHALVDVRVNGAVVVLNTQTITGRPLAMFSVGSTSGGASVVATYAGGTPGLSVSDASVLEGTGGSNTASFTVSLSPAAAVPVTVNFTTADGTATAPSDYTATAGSITFDPGVTTRTISVPIVTDAINEPTETFTVTLSNAMNANITRAQGIGTILNDDAPPPGLSIADASGLEGNAGSTPISLLVTLTPASAQAVTVNWATQDGTAQAGSDYTAASGTLTFAPGTTSLSIPVSLIGDTLIEPDETFTVVLSGAAGAQIVDGTGVVTIVNDDAVPTVGSFLRTTRSDFACGVLANAMLTQAADGEVRLLGGFGDEFTNPALGTPWTARTWAGGAYTPTISGGILPIGNANGAYVRSTVPQAVTSLDARAQFTAAAWEHVGWADLDFASSYLIFSTASTTNTLFARSNTGSGEQTTNLGPIPAGTHTYHIDRVSQATTDQIVYSIDGVVVATHTVPVVPAPLYVYLSTNGGATPTLNIDAIWLYPDYVAGTGTFDSCSLDAGSTVPWTTATWTAQTPTGSGLTVRTRTSTDGLGWSAWAPLSASGQVIASPSGRYLQYGVDLTSASTTTSPVLESLNIGFGNSGLPSLSVNSVSVLEGNSGVSNAVFTVTLGGGSTQPVSVNYATADGTATAGSDYAATGGTLTFAPGITTQTIPVPVFGDTINEPNETFLVTLSGAVNATIGAAQGTGTILNDDVPPPGLSVSDASALEGDAGSSTVSLTVTLTQASPAPVSVNWTTQDGTAVAGSDYVAASGTLTFAPGTTSLTIPVTIIGDTLIEPDETFTVMLSGASGAQIADGTGAITILNDDAGPTAGNFLRTTRSDFACGVPTNTILTLAGDGEIRLAGTFGDEFTGATLGTQWTAGTWAGGAYTPSIAGGILSIGNANGAFVRSTAVQTIATLEARAQFTAAPWQHMGWADLDFGGAYAIFSTFNTADTLFIRSNTGAGEQITNLGPIPAGTHSYRIDRVNQGASAQIVYSIDGVAVGTHTVTGLPPSLYVYLSSNGGATPTFNIDSVQLYPDYVPSGSFAGCSLDAGSNVTWTNAAWTAQIPAAASLTVRTRTSINGTNWSAWAPLIASGQVVSSPGGRYLQYGFDLASTSVSASPVVESFSVGFGDPVPALTVGNVSIVEGNAGITNAVFTVSLDVASTQTVSVNYSTADQTAVAGADYSTTAGTLTFAPGVMTQTIAVPVIGDTTYEPNETFAVNLSGATNAIIATAQAIGTITNDDTLPTLSINSIAVAEGNTGTQNATFTVTLSSASALPTTVAYATADGTATAGSDYTAVSGTLTFAPGVTQQTIAVPVLGDTIIESNETFTVTLSAPVNATLAAAQGVGTITNDDGTATLSINNVSVTEGNAGSVNAVFTVTLSAQTALTTTVNYATANGTATAGTDYTAISGTLTFAPGVTTQTVSVPVLGDTLFEANETFVVNLSGATNATITTAQGTGTITNNDTAPTLAINNVTVTEGNSGSANATFTVTLSAASGLTTTVNYATANGTATAGSDYTATSGTLTFAAGVTIQTISVPVFGDTLFEGNETFVVNLSGATNATIATAQGTGTITNNDTAPALSIDSVTVTEGNSGTTNATFTVTLSAVSGLTTTVNYATANGTATAGSDYTATSGTLTFAAGVTTRTVNVPVRGDTLYEGNETFVVNLSGATNATIAMAQGTGTITNDDPMPTLSINNVTVTEGNSGSANATFTVTLSATSGLTTTVNYATANGTATAGSDYTAATGTLTIAAGLLTGNITVPILGDTTPEADETFVVNLSNPVNATLAQTQATGTIVNNDGTVSISSPNTGGLNWAVGSSHAITWGTSGFGVGGSTFRIELSRNGGSTWTVLTPSVSTNAAGNGTFNWTVTGPATTQARIRITWTGNSQVTDTSNTNFTIQ